VSSAVYDHLPKPDGIWVCGCPYAKHPTTDAGVGEADRCRAKKILRALKKAVKK
jgi:hypothetical protein